MAIVKILIVTDADGGYGRTIPPTTDEEFHLGEFVRVLETTSWVGFNLEIVKAHRLNVPGSGADLTSFNFAAHDLNQYDIIFLFGISRDGDNNLPDNEAAAIARFMDAGGGLFATGDHEDLGAALAARLPRVRSMRRWYYPPAPEGLGASRNDTLREGVDDPDAVYEFDDQSDNRAQLIYPEWAMSVSSRYIIARYPHPLLCSPLGVVRYLPDHMHEGLCEVPDDLTADVTLGDYHGEEYPVRHGSSERLAPVMVANGQVIGGHGAYPYSEDTPTATTRYFGQIIAWDGWQARKDGHRMGRVVCDSTWHHFFNINLIGDSTSPEPRKRQGFLAPLLPGQTDHYEPIKHYFRNLVYWLIPYRRTSFILTATMTKMVARPQIQEMLSHWKDISVIRDRLSLVDYIRLARLADGYFDSVRGGCFTLQILPIILYPIWLGPIWEEVIEELDPWGPRFGKPVGPERQIDATTSFNPRLVADVILGANVLAAHQLHLTGRLHKDPGERELKEMAQLVEEYAGVGVRHLAEAARRGAHRTERMVKALAETASLQ